MKILIIGMTGSIHLARWLDQLSNIGWEIHLFPSMDYTHIHSDIRNVHVHFPVYCKGDLLKSRGIKCHGLYVRKNVFKRLVTQFLLKHYPDYRLRFLKKTIERLQPDIVHSMETQNAGYQLIETINKFGMEIPKWIHTVWGSDIYLFGRLAEHRIKIEELLRKCGYFWSESRRDNNLAKKFGFKGRILPIVQATGGFDFSKISLIEKRVLTSKRKKIILKGYQSWAGRALVGLRALERCKELLRDYTIIVYMPNEEVILAAKLFRENNGIPVEIVSDWIPHEQVLDLYLESRVFIGLSISDGVPNSMLEAMVMGAFPIQSRTSCADEWIDNNYNGILVPPEDPEIIEKTIRIVLKDDKLVDEAARYNYKLIKKRLDKTDISRKVIDVYKSISKINSNPD